MRRAITAATVAALGFVAPAFAQDELSYSFVELGYVNSEIDDLDIDGNGFGLRGSYAFSESFHGFAAYTDQDYDFDVGLSQFEIGGGMRFALNPKVDLVGTLSYLNVNLDAPGGFDLDDDGLALGLGVRGRATETLELRGEAKLVDYDEADSDTTFSVGARYYLTPMFALGADIGFNDDGTTWILGGRFDFNK
jgi:hypothetical protein